MSTEVAQPLTLGIGKFARSIDHVAIAVHDLEQSIEWYRDILGCELVERRTTEGRSSAMVSAVMKAGPLTFVLLQGTSPESQVSKYVEHFGPGVQHLAIEVDNLEATVDELKAQGVEFDTTIIRGPGLTQAFTRRDPGSGIMLEIIQRTEADGFADSSVQQLFEQLEEQDHF